MPGEVANNRQARRINLSNADRVHDRFIPSGSSPQVYRALSWSSDERSSATSIGGSGSGSPLSPSQPVVGNLRRGRQRRSQQALQVDRQLQLQQQREQSQTQGAQETMAFSLRDEHLVARPIYSETEHQDRIRIDSPERSIYGSSPSSSPLNSHDRAVAGALGFLGEVPRVLQYRHTPHSSSSSNGSANTSRNSNNLVLRDLDLTQPNKRNSAKRRITDLTPYKVLDSPRLRDDYYANLVSWSKISDFVVVGLFNRAYIWSEPVGARMLNPCSDEALTCISFSNADYIAMGTQEGRIMVYEQSSQDCVAMAFDEKCICSVEWMPDSSGLFTGNVDGVVTYYEVKKIADAVVLAKVGVLNYHAQQICGIVLPYSPQFLKKYTDSKNIGISVSAKLKQLAVGSNDNSCSIWDITDITRPQMKFVFRHKAAVKAIAYCPWSTSLLATGGGSRDRNIKFWHCKTGTLLDSLHTKGQITSLVWCANRKQICATFGFNDFKKSTLLAVYSYPKLELLMQSTASSSHLRTLSGAASPDSQRICVAANDETVRFYKIWQDKEYTLLAEAQEGGIYGSDLLELSEDISRAPSSLR